MLLQPTVRGRHYEDEDEVRERVGRSPIRPLSRVTTRPAGCDNSTPRPAANVLRLEYLDWMHDRRGLGVGYDAALPVAVTDVPDESSTSRHTTLQPAPQIEHHHAH